MKGLAAKGILVGIAMGVCMAVLGGCAPTVLIKVDGYRGPSAPAPASYWILPGMRDVASSDLQFQTFAGFLNPVLEKQGLTPAATQASANIFLYVAYGIGDGLPRTSIYATPSASVSVGLAVGSPDARHAAAPAGYASPVPAPLSVTYPTYFRYLVLEAVDAARYRDRGEIHQVWKTIVTSRGTQDDLRRLLPLMISAAAPHLGTDTRGQLEISVPLETTTSATVK